MLTRTRNGSVDRVQFYTFIYTYIGSWRFDEDGEYAPLRESTIKYFDEWEKKKIVNSQNNMLELF